MYTSPAGLNGCTLVVPTGKTASYKAANIWKSFGTVKEKVPATGITLNQTSASMTVGTTLQLVQHLRLLMLQAK